MNIELIPRLDDCNHIIGSQLIIQSEEDRNSKQLIFIFENTVEDESAVPNCVLLKRQGYKLYRDICDGKIYAVMVFVHLSDEIIDKNEDELGYMEKSEIIRGSLKSLLNSVIYDPFEPF